MAAVFTFENGKQICFDRTIYANGKYVLLKDYQLLDEERRAVRDKLTRANNQIDDLKEQIAKLEKTRSSLADNAVEWREKCEKAEKQIKELEHELRKKADSETDGLDFTEHDKKFKDEIKQLESELSDVQKSADEYYNKCIDLTKQIEKLKSELEAKVDFETDRLIKLPFDALETANMLINATYKRENCMTGIEYDKDIYSIDDLEQIAEHLLVYCKHNKDSE